jgi:catechol 2,3-dioxygenase-like lactoylglutathione lyase family enzyme
VRGASTTRRWRSSGTASCTRRTAPWRTTRTRAGLDFGIGRRGPVGGAHVAFDAEDTDAVDRFYETALAAGGRDNGPPGLRPQYAPGYYAAFVLDPDGNNIEAVHHG